MDICAYLRQLQDGFLAAQWNLKVISLNLINNILVEVFSLTIFLEASSSSYTCRRTCLSHNANRILFCTLSKVAAFVASSWCCSHECCLRPGPPFSSIFPEFRRMSHLSVSNTCPRLEAIFKNFPASKVFLWTRDCPEKVRVSFCAHRRFPLLSMISRDVIPLILDVRNYTVRPLFTVLVSNPHPGESNSLFDPIRFTCWKRETEHVRLWESKRGSFVGDWTRIFRLWSSNRSRLTAIRSWIDLPSSFYNAICSM